MQMHETQQVKEVYSPQDAKQLLKQGWTLIAVVAVSNPNKMDILSTCYVLGQTAPAQ
jgi:hypothetical protein